MFLRSLPPLVCPYRLITPERGFLAFGTCMLLAPSRSSSNPRNFCLAAVDAFSCQTSTCWPGNSLDCFRPPVNVQILIRTFISFLPTPIPPDRSTSPFSCLPSTALALLESRRRVRYYVVRSPLPGLNLFFLSSLGVLFQTRTPPPPFFP